VDGVEGEGGAFRRATLGPEDSSPTDVRAQLIAPEEGSTRTVDGGHGADPSAARAAGRML
jgi:hypothetical protein